MKSDELRNMQVELNSDFHTYSRGKSAESIAARIACASAVAQLELAIQAAKKSEAIAASNAWRSR